MILEVDSGNMSVQMYIKFSVSFNKLHIPLLIVHCKLKEEENH